MENKTKLEAALDELLMGKSTEEIVGPNGRLKQLTKALVERAMNAELSHHLGYEKHAAEGRGSGNNRNGKSRKKVQGDFGSGDRRAIQDVSLSDAYTHLAGFASCTFGHRVFYAHPVQDAGAFSTQCPKARSAVAGAVGHVRDGYLGRCSVPVPRNVHMRSA